MKVAVCAPRHSLRAVLAAAVAAGMASCASKPADNADAAGVGAQGDANSAGENRDAGSFADAGATDASGHDLPARDQGAPTGNGLPCGVERVLRARCQTCHNQPARFGAPMPLLTWADTQGTPPGGTGKIWELMKKRIDAGQMPPQATPSGALSSSENATLAAWFTLSAPQGTEICTAAPDGGVGSDGGAPPPVGPEALPCKPEYEFRAHGAGDKDPFSVPLVSNTYQCFTFPAPFDAIEQGIAWAPILDDTRVLHHWILYANSGALEPKGCGDPGRTFLMGWAPGGQNYAMPPGVGLDLPARGSWLTLEIHYNNKAQLHDARDRSGVALCTTRTPRAQEAGVITLGSIGIVIPPGARDYPVTGDCAPLLTNLLREPLHVLSAFPHMHQLGKSVRTDIVRGNQTIPVVDVPVWDFNSQRGYDRDPAQVVINPGDDLRTVCTYDNPSTSTVRFGGATEDEMCFTFLLSYPIGAAAAGRQCVSR